MKRYTTASGSVYEVEELKGQTWIRRYKLGQHHIDKGPAQVARRNADALGAGDWTKARAVQHHGDKFPLVINFDYPEKDLVTAPVVKVEECPP